MLIIIVTVRKVGGIAAIVSQIRGGRRSNMGLLGARL